MRAPWYERLFPDTRLGGAKNTESEFETTRGGSRMATSVGGVLTGRGGHIIVIDDPIKPADAMSEAVRGATNDWYDLSLLSRLDDKTTGAIIVVMQRLHVDDLTGHLLEQGGWTVLNLPAIAEADLFIPIGEGRIHHRKVGRAASSRTRRPLTVLEEQRRTMGSFNFAAQYQQDPVPPGGNMFDLAWFPKYGDGLAPGSHGDDQIYQSWDTASKAGELNDYSVCTTVAGARQRLLPPRRLPRPAGLPGFAPQDRRIARALAAQRRADRGQGIRRAPRPGTCGTTARCSRSRSSRKATRSFAPPRRQPALKVAVSCCQSAQNGLASLRRRFSLSLMAGTTIRSTR